MCGKRGNAVGDQLRRLCHTCCGFCILVSLVILVLSATVFLTYAFIKFPNHHDLKFSVTDASLTQLNFTNNTLHCDLTLDFTVRNPNRNVSINYGRAQVIASYRRKKFPPVNLTSSLPFSQGGKNTTNLHAVVKGQQLVVLDEYGLSMFMKETASGVFSSDLQLDLQISIKYGKVKTTGYAEPWRNVDYCKLKIPLSRFNQTSACGGFKFKSTECWKVQLSLFKLIFG